jgi:hypothetical protein
MMKKLCVLTVCVLLVGVGPAIKAENDGDHATFVVTSSNAPNNNELLVYDTTGALVQRASTLGQGGVSGNAGGIATQKGQIAVVNFLSQSVSIFDRGDNGFEVSQIVPTVSQPVSVAFGKNHLYVLGTTTVESHRIHSSAVEAAPDGSAVLVRADGTAAQVGVVGDQVIISEKSGVIEVVDLRAGAIAGQAVSVPLPAASQDTPFGLVTRGSNGYVTIAHSDEISLIKNGRLVSLAAIGSGFPSGPGQQAPCWITLEGPYLFTANSPSHSISRLVAIGRHLTVDAPVAAHTNGTPTDIVADDSLLAVVESNGGGQSHLTQFRVDEDGKLVQTASSAIGNAINGVAIVSEN